MIPPEFQDDGCSNSPDDILGADLRPACRLHDFRYCTRANPQGCMTPKARKAADKELRANIARAMPWYTQWIRWIYYRAVRRFGTISSYNTCGPDVGERCRHNLTMPDWMKETNNEEA